jgi:hypothetical protein
VTDLFLALALALFRRDLLGGWLSRGDGQQPADPSAKQRAPGDAGRQSAGKAIESLSIHR